MDRQESDDPDLRDRGFIYWRLLSTDPEAAKQVRKNGGKTGKNGKNREKSWQRRMISKECRARELAKSEEERAQRMQRAREVEVEEWKGKFYARDQEAFDQEVRIGGQSMARYGSTIRVWGASLPSPRSRFFPRMPLRSGSTAVWWAGPPPGSVAPDYWGFERSK